jgi:hypothetical protein
MKQLIAYSLYGSEERYTIGAIKNAILATRHFKGYTLRFYTGDSVPESIKQTLRLFPHVQIEEQWDQPEDHRAKLWRFQALTDQRYDVVLSRDADARLTHRERIAHEEFLASGLDFHIMKDHPTGHNYKISAGMFAARIRATPAHLDYYEPGDYYTADQDWLAAHIWPLIKDSALIHDEHYETPTEGQSKRRPFPIGKKATLHHIGAALEADDRFVFSIDQAMAKAESGSDKYLAEWLL